MGKLQYIGNRVVLVLDQTEKDREKAKKSKGNPTLKEVQETLFLILEALGVEIDG